VITPPSPPLLRSVTGVALLSTFGYDVFVSLFTCCVRSPRPRSLHLFTFFVFRFATTANFFGCVSYGLLLLLNTTHPFKTSFYRDYLLVFPPTSSIFPLRFLRSRRYLLSCFISPPRSVSNPLNTCDLPSYVFSNQFWRWTICR